jgi:hypothetical protein
MIRTGMTPRGSEAATTCGCFSVVLSETAGEVVTGQASFER